MSVSIEVFPPVRDGFYRQGPGDLSMPGKPHETSFPGERFTVKDRFGLNSKREGLNQTSGSYRQLYRQPVLLAGDSYR
ncbi:hypothetical protein [Xanthomonas theicola]|uniref:hypothetical protein n=1 Tax=Xanthomonas theicola TaxID=56464 RepID=UPI000FF87CF3|nr:hypothetical protein [Xanthomonas theicola]QNH23489.1 hypothetical protein G4Q83_10965 [Xanthomonas theicola]